MGGTRRPVRKQWLPAGESKSLACRWTWDELWAPARRAWALCASEFDEFCVSHVLLVVFRSHQRHSYCHKHGFLRGIRFGTQPGSDPLLACDPSRFHDSKQQERMWSPTPAQLRPDVREYANASPHSHCACRRSLVAHPCRRRLISSKFSTGFCVVMVDRGHVSRGKRTCRPYRNCAALMVVRGPRHSTKLAAAPSPLHP